MNTRKISPLLGIFLLIFVPQTVFGAENERILEPTRFQDVSLPELQPEEQAILEETCNELKNGAENPRACFEVLRRFLVLRSEKFVRENEDFTLQTPNLENFSTLVWPPKNPSAYTLRQKVSERIRDFLETLSPETLLAWRVWVDENVEAVLNSTWKSKNLPAPEELKRLIRENPFSSYEAEFWELLAQNAWQTGNAVRAAAYWEMELHVRALQMENLPRTFFLKKLPSEKTVRDLLQTSQPNSRITSRNIRKSEKTWRVSMTRILSPEGETVFEDLLPEDQRGLLFPDRKRNLNAENEEMPQFLTFPPNQNLLVARLGTRVSVWPEEERETRPQSFIVVLDLSRGGQLVWMKPPISVNSAFIGNPLTDAKRVYIPTLRLGKNAQISVDIYSLSDGTLQKIIPLFDVGIAEIQNPENETIFLPIDWTQDGKLLVGGVRSGVQMVVD